MAKKLDIETVLSRIDEACKKKNCTFLDFCDKEGNHCEYQGTKETFLLLQCTVCGNIWNTTSYDNFVNKSYKCPKCSIIERGLHERMTTKEFVERASIVHKNKYIYVETDLMHRDEEGRVKIICPIHGIFWQKPYYHLTGHGCNECKKELLAKIKSIDKEEFIRRARNKYGDEYDYSNVNYIKSDIPVDIICKKHGIFSQTPNAHLCGEGCPFCNESHLEREINNNLNISNIEFKRQQRFDWFGKQSYDFYLPQYNIAIECQGGQHFKAVKYFGGDEEFKKVLKRDLNKYNLSKEHNIKLIYIVNNNVDISSLNHEIYTEENTFHIKDFKKELLI